MSNEIAVRMGELMVSSEPSSVLMALGLGSCIGLCGYDPVAKVAGMAHIVLPSEVGRSDGLPAKSADIAVPNFINAMVKAGADRRRLRVAIAGGAQLFKFNGGGTTGMDVGQRNIAEVRRLLSEASIRPVAAEVGGNSGRTVKLYTATGIVTVRRAGGLEEPLADLSRGRELAVAA